MLTHFATTFILLQSLHDSRAILKQMFVSNKWSNFKYAHDSDDMNAINWVFDDAFWQALHEIIHV